MVLCQIVQRLFQVGEPVLLRVVFPQLPGVSGLQKDHDHDRGQNEQNHDQVVREEADEALKPRGEKRDPIEKQEDSNRQHENDRRHTHGLRRIRADADVTVFLIIFSLYKFRRGLPEAFFSVTHENALLVPCPCESGLQHILAVPVYQISCKRQAAAGCFPPAAENGSRPIFDDSAKNETSALKDEPFTGCRCVI